LIVAGAAVAGAAALVGLAYLSVDQEALRRGR
jgi:hypothetical protein